MIVSGEFDEVDYNVVAVGQSAFTTPGIYSWTVPDNVTTINVVAIGGGGGGAAGRDFSAGAGGALAYVNFIPVTPGEILTVGVGTSGIGANRSAGTQTDGGNSYVRRGGIGGTSLVEAGGGKKGNNFATNSSGGLVIVGTGGSGGQGGTGDTGRGGGGGGAGGYSGNGGSGGGNIGSSGSGGGGGGGSSTIFPGGGGGGVGIYGRGLSGSAVSGSGVGGIGGSGGQNGQNRQSLTSAGDGGNYGGGGGAGDSSSDPSGFGGSGAVRIIWGLDINRIFPISNLGDFGDCAKPSISGLGTYSALEFTENIGITTTLTANVFAPYDPVYDEFGGVLFGPGQGTFMRQNLSGDVIVYNEIDEIGLDPTYVSIVE
jgi:hypothetical protein